MVERVQIEPYNFPNRRGVINNVLPNYFSKTQLDSLSPAIAFNGHRLFAVTDLWSDRRIGVKTKEGWKELNLPKGWVREPRYSNGNLLFINHQSGCENGELYSINLNNENEIYSIQKDIQFGQICDWNGKKIALINNGNKSYISMTGEIITQENINGSSIIRLPKGILKLPNGSKLFDISMNPCGEKIIISLKAGLNSKNFCLDIKGNLVGPSTDLPLLGNSLWIDNNKVLISVDEWPRKTVLLWNVHTGEHKRIFSTEIGVIGNLVKGNNNLFFSWTSPSTPRTICEIPLANLSKNMNFILPKGSMNYYSEVLEIKGIRIPCIIREPIKNPIGLVILIHGGPNSSTWPEYSPLCELFVDLGYKVVQPNVRGSLIYNKSVTPGFPKKYGNDDVVDIVNVARHYNHKRTVFAGISYGAYLASRASSFYKNSVGVISLSGFLSIQSLRKSSHTSVKEFVDFAFEENYIEDKLSNVPYFIAHGCLDDRIPIEVLKDQAKGGCEKSIFLELPYEGHGITSDQAAIDVYPKLIAWLNII